MGISVSDTIGKEIADVLGLEHVRKMVITLETNSVALIDVEMYIEKDGARQFPAIFKRFKIADLREPAEVTALGDEYAKYVYKDGKD